MKFDSRDVALAAVFMALYVVINVLQASTVGNPTLYGPVQLRVADCLIALAALFGAPVIAGVTVGCFLTNMISFVGGVDVAFGPVANLVAATLVFAFRKHKFPACILGALPVGLIVGSYLWLFFPPPSVLSLLPEWAAMIVSITISSLIAVAGIGYALLLALSRPSVIGALRSSGLKLADEG